MKVVVYEGEFNVLNCMKVVVYEDAVREKPSSVEEAREYIRGKLTWYFLLLQLKASVQLSKIKTQAIPRGTQQQWVLWLWQISKQESEKEESIEWR